MNDKYNEIMERRTRKQADAAIIRQPKITTSEVAWTKDRDGHQKAITWQSCASRGQYRIYGNPAASPQLAIDSLTHVCMQMHALASDVINTENFSQLSAADGGK